MIEDNGLEILDVRFLTPARILMKEDGVEKQINVSIDIINREVYGEGGELLYCAEQIFEYLDRVNTLPEEFFMAPDDVQDRASEAYGDHEKMRQAAGGLDVGSTTD